MKTKQLALMIAFGCTVGLASVGAKGGAAASPGNPHGMGGGPSPSNPSDLPGPSPAADHSAKPESAAPAAQQLASSMHDINQTAFNERRELVGSVDMRLKSSHEALRKIQTNAKDLRGSAHEEFMASLDTVKAREVDLHAAVKASQEADAGNWEVRRAALARADRDYADAVAHLQALAPPIPKP